MTFSLKSVTASKKHKYPTLNIEGRQSLKISYPTDLLGTTEYTQNTE